MSSVYMLLSVISNNRRFFFENKVLGYVADDSTNSLLY